MYGLAVCGVFLVLVGLVTGLGYVLYVSGVRRMQDFAIALCMVWDHIKSHFSGKPEL